MSFKISSFGYYSQRIDYTKQGTTFTSSVKDLNCISINSFHHFKNQSLPNIFKKFFPIFSKNKNKILSLKRVILGKPNRSFEQVRDALGSYDFPITLHFNYKIKETQIKLPSIEVYKDHLTVLKKWLLQKLHFQKPKLLSKIGDVYIFTDQSSTKSDNLKIQIKIKSIVENNLFFDFELENDQKIFFGNYPLISDKGTFLINGNEKVVVFQLVRAPGVYFNKLEKNQNYDLFSAEIIPGQGTWIDFITKMVHLKDEEKTVNVPVLELILDKEKSKSFSLIDLFTIFGFEKETILSLFNHAEEVVNSYQFYQDIVSAEEAVNRVYYKIFPPKSNFNLSFNFKFKAILNAFFGQNSHFSLAGVGRYKLNHKLFVGNALYKRVLAQNLVDRSSKKVIFTKGTWISPKVWPKVKEFLLSGNNLEVLDFAKTKIAGWDKVQIVEVYSDNDSQDKVIKLVGIDPSCLETTLNVADLLAVTAYLLNLNYEVGKIDDIDSLANRNVKAIDELLERCFNSGLYKVKDEVTKKLDDLTIDQYNHKIVSLINSGSLSTVVREFFNTSQLSQFLDQTNPLTELSNKRRITILGESGLKRESASAKVRDIHPSYSGKICPIETPEGPNIGLITNLSFYASLNKWKFIQTPYWKVKNGFVTKTVVYLSALEEERTIIAPATTPCNSAGKILVDYVTVLLDDNLTTVPMEEVEYFGYSSQQMFSVSTVCIPFLQHNDANRALMGANMQKQAVPLINSESPIVGTGNEFLIARDSGFALVNKNKGVVTYADSEMVKVQEENGQTEKYHLTNFLASNQRSAFFHNLLVQKKDHLEDNQIVADGSSVKNGELAIGKNLLVAFTTWKGYNFEDALIISDRLVQDDVFTSLHIEEYEIKRLRTNLGNEEFTNQVPNTSNYALRFLDEDGIVLVGSEVKPGDILVGKVTLKDKGKLTPEDLLLNQLFHGLERHVENNSLVVPNGGGGIVQKIQRYSKKDYANNLTADVIEIIKVSVVQKISIKQGDKLCNRHGNKGVISRILPANSMPYLVDGTSIDIMINPLGVPSRMNVGQLLEMHLAYAAHKLGYQVSTPIFNGANTDDLLTIMKKANLSLSGKEALYDGETGRSFDQKVAVGMMYYLKLSHMVETKIHARDTGPYALVTQQPLKGKAQNGGQRFGEMEVWALESHGAAYNLQELLTIKSDDIKGRNAILHAIIEEKTKNFHFQHYPESFNVLLSEMRALCLNVEILKKDEPTELSEEEEERE